MTLEQLIRAVAANVGRLPEQIGVKSIQRGTGTIQANQNSITVNISAVNPNRCIVLLNVSGGYVPFSNTGGYALGAYINGLTTTQLTVYRASSVSNVTYFSYQIIEFF